MSARVGRPTSLGSEPPSFPRQRESSSRWKRESSAVWIPTFAGMTNRYTDGAVKSLDVRTRWAANKLGVGTAVIPAKAGIQFSLEEGKFGRLDSRFRGN